MQFTVIKNTEEIKKYLLGMPPRKGVMTGGNATEPKNENLASARFLSAKLKQRQVLNAQYNMLLDNM